MRNPFIPALIVECLLLAPVVGQEDLSQQAYRILEANCFECHGAAVKQNSLDLRTRKSILAGGERGPAVAPTNLRESRLYQFAAHLKKPTMPPGKRLSDEQVKILRRWILAGASLDGVEAVADPDEAERRAALARLEDRPVSEEERQFWAFQPPLHQPPPAVAGDWSEHPIDAFLLAAMQKRRLRKSPRADRRRLIRRAYLDLTGLPPAPREIDAFLADKSPDAWEKVINRLLESPHYGERWGRHWLDLVRYADSGGFEHDHDWPSAWRYRDYVVQSFNQDKPYDQFIREQLAGDELHADSDEAMIATGFLRLGPDNNLKTERTRMDELDDLISTTSLAFLGMTVKCARCHDHKFDPIRQKDYYQMQAVFFSTKGVEHPLVTDELVAAHEAEQRKVDELQLPVEQSKENLEEPYRKRLFEERIEALPPYLQVAWRTSPDERTEGQRLNARQIQETLKIEEKEILAVMSAQDKQQRQELIASIEELGQQRPEPYPRAMVIGEESRDPLPSHFLHRGSPDARGSLMSPGVLTVASNGDYRFPTAPQYARSSWRRAGLANWIASPDNPLTARVMVNRIWQHHFGEGIVRTPSNFGSTGEPPTHPQLLDWLAVEFERSRWSIKAMHRLMMTSRAYRMESNDIPENLRIDRENRYFWRMPRHRLEAETIRDSIMAVAGTLDRTLGGTAVFPYIDPDLFQSSTGRTWPGRPNEDTSTWRRSIYVFSKRSIRYPLFEAFDQPDLINSCDRRNRSTIAPQALLLMNNELILMQADHFARRLESDAPGDLGMKIERAFQLALARPPTEFERTRALEFIGGSPDGLVDFCQALFNLNEFVYRQ